MTHYHGLFVGYGLAMLGWLVVARLVDRKNDDVKTTPLWSESDRIVFTHPWREIGWVLLAVAGTIGIGQLYMAGIRLPASGRIGFVTESINQLLIFSPFIALLVVRKQSRRTAWLPATMIPTRLLYGLALAILAIGGYSLSREMPLVPTWSSAFLRLDNVPYAVQVLMEDIGIAMVFVRVSSAIGDRATIILVAVLFSAGHIPAMLTGGASGPELLSLLLDAALGVGIISVVKKSRDVWWFWCVHFAMDMMQFIE